MVEEEKTVRLKTRRAHCSAGEGGHSRKGEKFEGKGVGVKRILQPFEKKKPAGKKNAMG